MMMMEEELLSCGRSPHFLWVCALALKAPLGDLPSPFTECPQAVCLHLLLHFTSSLQVQARTVQYVYSTVRTALNIVMIILAVSPPVISLFFQPGPPRSPPAPPPLGRLGRQRLLHGLRPRRRRRRARLRRRRSLQAGTAAGATQRGRQASSGNDDGGGCGGCGGAHRHPEQEVPGQRGRGTPDQSLKSRSPPEYCMNPPPFPCALSVSRLCTVSTHLFGPLYFVDISFSCL